MMSFGRRLALFFVLIVLVPALALVGMLVIVSGDSRRGKADAALAAGLETALALYEQRSLRAEPVARELAREPLLGSGLRSGNPVELRRFARAAAARSGVAAVEVLGPAGTVEASAGAHGGIAFARLDLEDHGAGRGELLVSVTGARAFAAELRRLTGRDLVVRSGERVLAATLPPPEAKALAPPEVALDQGETGDLEIDGSEHRAHLLGLDDERDESVLMVGPRLDEGLAIQGPVAALLALFLAAALALAYVLARALTGLHAQVAQQAVTDPLTGLSNRRRMDQLMEREAERALRFGHELSLLIVDADDFKGINDEHGHLVGDVVLETIADVVRSTVRAIDVSARYGGDELAVLLIETGADGARIVADRLREGVRRAPIEGLGRGRVTITVGLATLPECARDAESLIAAADQALLAAKREGKDRTRRAAPTSRHARNGHGRGSAAVRAARGRRARG